METATTFANSIVDFLFPVKGIKLDKKSVKELYDQLHPQLIKAFDEADIVFPSNPAIIEVPTKRLRYMERSLSKEFCQTVFTHCQVYVKTFDRKTNEPVGKEVGRGDYKSLAWTPEVVGKTYYSFSEWFVKTMLSQLLGLSNESLVQMIQLATLYNRGKFRIPEDQEKGVIDIASRGASTFTRFDFNAKTVLNSRGVVRRANSKVYFANQCFDSKLALYVMAVEILGAGSSATNAIINGLPSLWMREDNYGAEMSENDATRVILDNLTLPVDFITVGNRRAKVFPYMGLMNGNLGPSDLQNILQTGVQAAPDKYNIDWITTGVGAEAMLLGFYDDAEKGRCVVSIHDMSKPGKVYNRAPQSAKYLRADSIYREISSLKVKLSNGKFAELGGIFKETAFTNSRFATFGSGVAAINKGVTFVYSVKKTATRTLSLLRLPSEVREAFAKLPGGLLANVKAAIETRIEELVAANTVVEPGEDILTLLNGSYVVIKNNSEAQTLRITGGRVIDDMHVNSRYADTLQIVIETVMEAEDTSVKLRGLGIKLTTMFYRIKGLSKPWEILLNNETVKGNSALIHMYALAQGGGVYDPHGAVLYLNNGDVVDFKQSQNKFTDWAKNSAVEETLNFKMARSIYNELLEKTDVFEGDDVWVVDNDSKDHVIVYEKVKVIYGKLPYDVEVSTPREAVGVSTLTLEQVSAISLQHQKLSETLIEEAKPRREAVAGLVEMLGTVKLTQPDVPTINISNRKGREQLREVLGAVRQYNLELDNLARVKNIREGLSLQDYVLTELGMTAEEVAANPKAAVKRIKEFAGYANDRDIFKVLHKHYPNGLSLAAYNFTNGQREEVLHFKPKAIESLAAFSASSGTGIALDIIALLCFITDEGNENTSGYADTVFSMLVKVSYALSTWTKKMVQSAGVLKKMSRSGRVVMGKVKTSFHHILHSEDGIPVIGIHPQCPIGKLLRVKDGDLVAINRTPMPFITACRVKFTVLAPVCHILVDALSWAASNEGDSDGDGIGAFSLKPYGITDEDARQINNSYMGMAGYWFCYSKEEVPFAGFMSYSDKHGKKDFTKLDQLTDKKGNKVGIAALIPIDEYGEKAALVANHYRFNVGISYGVCSTLTFATVNLAYSNPNPRELKLYTKACAVAWRLVYEGLGLSGYSPEASQFFEALFMGVIAKSKPEGKIYRASVQKTEQYLSNCDFFDLDPDNVTPINLVGAYKQMVKMLENDDESTQEDFLEAQEAFAYLDKAITSRRLVGKKEATSQDEEIDYMGDMKECLPKAVANDEAVRFILQRLINSRQITSAYSRMERGAYVPESIQDWAIIYGSLRRMGQGKDPVEVGDSYSMEEDGVSLFVRLVERDLAETLQCDFLKNYLEFGGAIFSDLVYKIRKMNDDID